MENPLNIQNTFFNQARKDRSKVTIFLTSGTKLIGRIRSFDKFTLILDSSNGEQMIFKHAISTVSPHKTFGNYIQMDRNKATEVVAPGEKQGGPAAEHVSGNAPNSRTK